MSVAVDRSTLHRIFISYSSEDSDFALRLQDELQKYRPPSGYARLQVQKDEPDFTETDYYQVVSEHLQQSDLLIVICSQYAKVSEPVQQAINLFLSKQPPSRLIFVRYADTSTGVVSDYETMPSAVKSYFDGNFTADFTNMDPDSGKLTQIEFESSWFALLSRIYDLSTGDLYDWATESAKRRRIKQFATGGIAVLAFLSILGVGEWTKRAAAAEDIRKAQLLEAKRVYDRSAYAASQNHQLRAYYLGIEAVETAPDKDKEQFLSKLPGGFAAELKMIIPANADILGVHLNRDQSRLYYHTKNNDFRAVDIKTSEEIFTFQENNWITGMMLDQRETNLFTWGQGNSIQMRDANNGKAEGPEMRHRGAVIGAALNQKGNNMLSWSADGTARLWDLATRKQIGQSMKHVGWVVGATWLAKEERILTWGSDSTAKIWNAKNGSAISSKLTLGGEGSSAIVLNDNESVLIISNNNVAYIWDESGRRTARSFRHDGPILGARTTRDEKLLLTWSQDHSARLWDLKTGKSKTPPMKHDGWIFGARFDNAEKRIVTWSFDNSLRLWNAETGSQIGSTMRHSSGPKGSDSGVFGATFIDGENAILSWGDDNTARIWSCDNAEQLNPTLQHRNGLDNRDVKGALIAQTQGLLVTWSSDSTARIWQLNTPLKATTRQPLTETRPQKIQRMLQKRSGTIYNNSTGIINAIPYDEWVK
ncbi:MAG: toll/interleukin-1 receptor domain-containing protein [Calditrichia bacterium]